MTERQLQRAVAQYLAAVLDPAQVLYFHCPNEGKRGPMARADFALGGGLAGVPDFYLAWRWMGPASDHPYEMTAWLELKAAKGRLSSAQEAFRDRALALGHHWGLARDLTAVGAMLRVLEVPCRPHRIFTSGTVKLEVRA